MIKKIFITIFINILFVILIDFVFGIIFNTPKYLSKKNYDWGMYHSNYRGYFDKLDKDGETVYGIDYSKVKYDNIKPPTSDYDGLKVVAIGDSFTEGQGVRRTDTYSNMLSLLTNDQVRGFNHGKGGDDIYQVTNRFLAKDFEFKPDVIIYGYCINDIPNFNYDIALDIDNNKERAKEYKNDYPLKWDFINLRTNAVENSRGKLLKFFTDHSNIINYFARQIELKDISRRTTEYYLKTHDEKFNPKGIEKLKEQILKMKAKADEYGAQFTLMIFPIIFWPNGEYPFGPIHEKMRQIAKDLGIDVIDLKDTFLKYPDSELWVHPVDQHPNDFAQKITSEKIIEYLKQKDLLK